MRMGLRLRIILILTVPTLLAVGAHGFLRVRQEEAQLLREDREAMDLTARAIRIAVENAARDRQTSDVKRLLVEMVNEQESIDRIRLFDQKLQATLVSNPLAIGDGVPATGLRRVMDTGTPEVFLERGRPSFLYYLVPLRNPAGDVEGAMEIVRLASGIDRRLQAAVRDVAVRLSILLAVIVVATAIAMQRQVLAPLARLLRGIQALGQGQPGPPLPVSRRDEVGRVAEAFNDMSVRLDAAQGRLLELEQQLGRAAALAMAGKLASALAHEVGTPLNIVSGRAELLLKELGDREHARRDLELIVAQIDRVSAVITSLLDTVRVHGPKIQAVVVSEVLDPVMTLLRHTARQRGVSLVTSWASDVPPVLADPGHLQQVVINLVVNALDATAADGRVVMTAAADRAGHAGVTLAVSDTGTGIAADVLPRLFQPFFTTKPRGQGTGLGLSICRDIVKMHGGDIQVDTEVGRGSTFTVWLPAAVREAIA